MTCGQFVNSISNAKAKPENTFSIRSKEISMKRTIATLSFALVFAVTAFAQTSQSQPKPEKLSKQQLNTLIATAKTPAEHSRIAQYYGAEAQADLAQSKDHEQMVEQFKQNPTFNSSKLTLGTVNHCEYLAQHYKENAAKMQQLSQDHEQMAKAAAQK
jgi:hypothetical protein